MAVYDPADDGAEMQFDGRMSYVDYLHLDEITSAQKPLSQAHDELLFIIQHQTSELWLKLALHELNAARQAISQDALPMAFKMLARVARIFEQLNNAWDVLRTMTPSDYTTFRAGLGQSSGFQSHQYRLIEFVLGNRNSAMIKPHAHRDDLRQLLEDEIARPSLYDEVIDLAVRQGLALSVEARMRDRAMPHREVPEITQMWRRIYADTLTTLQFSQTSQSLGILA